MENLKGKRAAGRKGELVVPIEDVLGHLDPDNVRIHGERSRDTIRESLKRFGAARSVVMDGDGVIRAGNGILEEAASAGVTRVRVVQGDPHELVIVQRADLTGDDAVAYGIVDNRASELSAWDTELLGTTIEEIGSDISHEQMGFAEGELDSLLGILIDEPIDTDDPIPHGEMPSVRRVHLLFDTETVVEFEALVEKLSAIYGMDNATDTVVRALRNECEANKTADAERPKTRRSKRKKGV